jgi:hypothetical protein
MSSTLPTDSAERKEYPLYSGVLRYFPAALAGVAHHSLLGNRKHCAGSDGLIWNRKASSDHADCILRHLVDLAELLSRFGEKGALPADILSEADAIAWRGLALSQSLHENFAFTPLAPASLREDKEPC